jgi:hypothetical protein
MSDNFQAAAVDALWKILQDSGMDHPDDMHVVAGDIINRMESAGFGLVAFADVQRWQSVEESFVQRVRADDGRKSALLAAIQSAGADDGLSSSDIDTLIGRVVALIDYLRRATTIVEPVVADRRVQAVKLAINMGATDTVAAARVIEKYLREG